VLDGQSRSTAGITVQLCDEDGIEVDTLGEGLCRGNRVLSGHRIHDHEYLVRTDGLLYAGGLGHHLLIDMETACRVDDDHIAHLCHSFLDAGLSDGNRV
jgi:hypothetical protein